MAHDAKSNSFLKDISMLFSKYSHKTISRGGFLLIELLVAMALFSTIVTIAVGSFVNVLRTQRQVSALVAAESNLGIAMEQMAREMRTGSLFCIKQDGTTDPDCNSSIRSCVVSVTGGIICPNIKFTNAAGNSVKYSFDQNNGVLEKTVGYGGATQNVTGGNVKIRYLSFYLLWNSFQNGGSGKYPRITIAVGISPNDVSLSGNVLNLETTVSARQINPSWSRNP